MNRLFNVIIGSKSLQHTTTFQSFHSKVESYTKSKPKKVNESRLKKIIENELSSRDRGDHFKVVGLKNLANTKKH